MVNVSSPNTPGLRGLQAVETLRPLLEAVRATGIVQDVQWDEAGERLQIFVDGQRASGAEATAPLVQAFQEAGAAFVDLHVGARLEDRFAQETSEGR